MFDLIVMYIEDCLLVLMALAAYLYLIISVYPRLTMRAVWRSRRKGAPAGDRGVRKLLFPGGRAIVYEPTLSVRRFIRHYALVKQDGCTYIQCRIHERIALIRYDVATFDRRGKLLDIVSVREWISEPGQTSLVRLPRETAYASVTLRKADAMYKGREKTVGYSLVGTALYAALTVVTAVAADIVLHGCLSEICGALGAAGILPDGGPVTPLATSMSFAVILGLVCAAWGVLIHYIHANKVLNR